MPDFAFLCKSRLLCFVLSFFLSPSCLSPCLSFVLCVLKNINNLFGTVAFTFLDKTFDRLPYDCTPSVVPKPGALSQNVNKTIAVLSLVRRPKALCMGEEVSRLQGES